MTTAEDWRDGGDRKATAPADANAGATPPHDLDAEAACMSAVMLDPTRLPSVDFLLPRHMYSEAHRQIWQAILDLRDLGETIDVLTVQSRLKDTKRLAQVGGSGYLTEILDAAPVVQNLRAYGMTVFERWRLREAIVAAQRVAASGYTASVPDVQGFIETATKAFVVLGRDSPAATTLKNWQILRPLVEQMAVVSRQPRVEGARSRTVGLPTGIRCLDAETMGMNLGDLIILAAESGRGKTTMAVQMLMHAAGWRGLDQPLADRRVAGLMFSTEIPKEQIGIMQLAHAAKVDSRRLKQQSVEPTLTADEWDRIMRAMPVLEQLAIFTDDRPHLSVDHVVTATRLACEQSKVADGLPVGLVALDYVQRLAVPEHQLRKREDEQIRYSANQLKELAKAERLPVLALAQLNPPDPKTSPTGRPYKWLVARSKGIEQEADQVLCLWRIKRDDKTGVRITCTKQRSGEEFDVDLTFDPVIGTFYDPAYIGFTSAFEGF